MTPDARAALVARLAVELHKTDTPVQVARSRNTRG